MAWQTNQGKRSQDTRASQHPCVMQLQDVGASGTKQRALRAKQVGCHRERTKLQWMIGGVTCTIDTVYQKIVPPVPRFRLNLESRGAVSLPQGDHRYCMRYRGLLEHLQTEHNPVCWALAGMQRDARIMLLCSRGGSTPPGDCRHVTPLPLAHFGGTCAAKCGF